MDLKIADHAYKEHDKMKYIDITEEVFQLYDAEEADKLAQEVKQEMEKGDHHRLNNKLAHLLSMVQQPSAQVVKFPATMQAANEPLMTTELMAASGQELGNWFDQPIRFSSLELDVRRIIGTDNEVSVFITSNGGESVKTPLEKYKGKMLKVDLTVNNTDLLTAVIYVDDEGFSAEGEGQLIRLNHEEASGSFNVFVKELN